MIQHFSEMCLIKKKWFESTGTEKKRPQKQVNGISHLHCYDLLGHLSGFIL